MIHRLTLLRREFGLNITALSKISGVSESTIVRIERDLGNRINYSTAEAIAKAVNREVYQIFSGEELTHIGRPALSGRPIKSADEPKTSGRLCLNCFLELPIMEHDECPNCGSKYSMEDQLEEDE